MYSQTLDFLFGLFIIVQNINFQMLTTYKMSIKTYNMHVHREQANLMFNDCYSIKWVDVYDTNSGSACENWAKEEWKNSNSLESTYHSFLSEILAYYSNIILNSIILNIMLA